MKGFLQEYGIIMVVVAVVLGMLAFGKTGYAKSIQDAILGSADHIVETGENIVPKPVKASDTIEVEGTKYVVLEERENNQVLVMTASSIGKRAFQSSYDSNTKLRPDGQNANTYEGSEIDNYLENEWYNSLSSTIKAAIQATNIKQASYDYLLHKHESGYNDQVYNTINRHVFLPSIDEVGKAFLNGDGIWTRDSFQGYANYAMYLSPELGRSDANHVDATSGIRPAFVIDLSQVDYKVTGHTDYK